MVRLVLSNEKMITLTRGNKTIKRSEVDYKTNKKMYDFRGFKVAEDFVDRYENVFIAGPGYYSFVKSTILNFIF